MELHIPLPDNLKDQFESDKFKGAIEHILFDLSEYVSAGGSEIYRPLSGDTELKLLEALKTMFDNAEPALTEEETSTLRAGCKSRLTSAFPWTAQFDLSYSHEYGDSSMWMLLENYKTERSTVIIEDLSTHQYMVETDPGKDKTMIAATPEAMERVRAFLGTQH